MENITKIYIFSSLVLITLSIDYSHIEWEVFINNILYVYTLH